tara:strand:+ start:3043 stop:3228 length:186 start_codon:yes stop_codon:yes gene_type:complete
MTPSKTVPHDRAGQQVATNLGKHLKASELLRMSSRSRYTDKAHDIAKDERDLRIEDLDGEI